MLHGRGGYCFELNTLYAELQLAVRYRVSQHLARVWLRASEDTPPRTHLALLVDLGGQRFLTDVGFGARASRVPLDIDDETAVDDGDGLVRIIPINGFEKIAQRKQDGAWRIQYNFELFGAVSADVEVANHYMSTHLKSHFWDELFIGLFQDTGRIGLWNQWLTKRSSELLEESKIASAERWLSVTSELFGLTFPMSETEQQKIAAALAGGAAFSARWSGP